MIAFELLTSAKEGLIPYALLRHLAQNMGVSPGAMLDELGHFVAVEYSDAKMTYEEADTIMNAAFGVSVTEEFWAENDSTIPPTMYEVYEAFDAGEYYHHGDPREIDPELKYTKPLIAKFLSTHSNVA